MSSLMTLENAEQAILKTVQSVKGTRTLPPAEALGCVLSEDIICPMDLPPFRSSAMDGYAFQQSGKRYRQTGTSLAGHPFNGVLGKGECVRIFTGAMLPAEADTVALQELVHLKDGVVHLETELPVGANVRSQGLDKSKGQVLLGRGQRLSAAGIGLLTSAGITEVACTRAVQVALYATGDELTQGTETLAQGCIYESNLAMLAALMDSTICQIAEQQQLPDDKDIISKAIRQAANYVDVVITSGGVSVGDADFVLSAFQQQGQLSFWRIALKPGMPMVFGEIKQAAFFGLPGNPVSTVVTFTELVAPALIQMAGAKPERPIRLQARLQGQLKKDTDRTEFQRGYFVCDAKGQASVRSSGDQGSGRISSLAEANCYIVLEPGDRTKQEGDLVVIQPF